MEKQVKAKMVAKPECDEWSNYSICMLSQDEISKQKQGYSVLNNTNILVFLYPT